MAEKNSPVEISKVLGRRRLGWGVEYLVQREDNAPEEWVPYRLLHNSKELVKEYNSVKKCAGFEDESSGLPNGVDRSLTDGKINRKRTPRKQQVRRMSFPLASHSVTLMNHDGHSTSSFDVACSSASPKKSAGKSPGPVRKNAKLLEFDLSQVAQSNDDKLVKKKRPRIVDSGSPTLRASLPETVTPLIDSYNDDKDIKMKSLPAKSSPDSERSLVPKTKSKRMKLVRSDSSLAIQSKSTQINNCSVHVKKERSRKNIAVAPDNIQSTIDAVVAGELGLDDVLYRVSESQGKSDQQTKRRKKPVARKTVSKIVKKSMHIQRSKPKPVKSNRGKANSTTSNSETNNPVSEMPELKNKGNGKQKLNKPDAPRPNQGKSLVVKLGMFKKKSLLGSDVNSGSSRNSSAVTSDSEGMLYSLADADVSSMSTSDSDSDNERAKKAGIKQPLLSRKKLVLRLTDLRHDCGNSTGNTTPTTGNSTPATGNTTPDSDHDSEITFKQSPRKLLLKDSIRPKSKSEKSVSKMSVCVKPVVVKKQVPTARSNTAVPSICQTPPRPHRETSPSLASTNDLPRIPPVIPILPNSPSPLRYAALIKNITSHYPNGRGVKRQLDSDSDREPVERRVSVRHSESAFKYKEIVVKKCQNYTQIWLFSQTKRKNALNPQVFQELINAFHNAKYDDSRVVLLTGSGQTFCSGVDLHYLITGDRKLAASQMVDSMKEFIKALIAFPKPVMAAVNGPAVGLGVAILPLCDVIYASDKASFYCPYTKLGQTPEGCSSYTFTQAMGLAMANELLLAGRKITALEAYQIGLVSQVFWPTSMMQEVMPRLQQMANTSAKALEASKVLMRGHLHGKLQTTVDIECQMLHEIWLSSECQRAILAYTNEDEDMML